MRLCVSSQRIAGKQLKAIGAKIIAPRLVKFLAELLALLVIDSFEQVVYFVEMIAVFGRRRIGRVECDLRDNADFITQVDVLIDLLVASIARIVNHGGIPFDLFGPIQWPESPGR